jgi:hypothetical protein
MSETGMKCLEPEALKGSGGSKELGPHGFIDQAWQSRLPRQFVALDFENRPRNVALTFDRRCDSAVFPLLTTYTYAIPRRLATKMVNIDDSRSSRAVAN